MALNQRAIITINDQMCSASCPNMIQLAANTYSLQGLTLWMLKDGVYLSWKWQAWNDWILGTYLMEYLTFLKLPFLLPFPPNPFFGFSFQDSQCFFPASSAKGGELGARWFWGAMWEWEVEWIVKIHSAKYWLRLDLLSMLSVMWACVHIS